MLIYYSNWSRDPAKEAEHICECDAWIEDSEYDVNDLILSLKRKVIKNKERDVVESFQHCEIRLSKDQLIDIIKIAKEKGIVE